MTRTDTLRARRLKKQMQMRALQAQIDDIDAEILQASAKERGAEMRQWREGTFAPTRSDYKPSIFDPSREVGRGGGCGEARAVVVVGRH